MGSIMLAFIRRFPLWQWVLFGLVTGALFGFVLEEQAASLKWIGQIFINLIMMVIAPLVFFSIVSGVISLGDPKLLGRMGMKSLLAFLVTTVIGIAIALTVANVLPPGLGVPQEVTSRLDTLESTLVEDQQEKAPTVAEILIGIIPNNALLAMTERNILQVIFFAIVVGVVMVLMQGQTPRITEIVHEAANIFYKIIELVILLAPPAVFALTAWTVGVMGIDAIIALSKFVGVVVLVCLMQYVVLAAMVVVFTRLSPLPYIKKCLEFQLIGFSTSSSSATLPTTMRVAQQRLGVSSITASMVIPLGATVNMNGTAIYLAVCAVFISQLYGIPLSMDQYLVIITTITLVAIGTAAVPGGSIVMMPIVFASVGLPVEAIALILGVDRILDMVRTTINITGDVATAVVVDHSEGKLDTQRYTDSV